MRKLSGIAAAVVAIIHSREVVHFLKHRKYIVALAVSGTLLGAGCEDAFTSKGEYRDRMVVYGVLSNRTDSQHVRIYTSYDPVGFNPLANTKETMVRGADVRVSDATRQFRFVETMVRRFDKSRYNDDIVSYVAHPFSIEPGKTYTLTVTSPEFGKASSSVAVPKRGRVQFFNPYVLKGGGEKDEQVVVYGWIRELTYGVLMRLYLVYDALEAGVWVPHIEEVPASVNQRTGGTTEVIYPSLRRRESRETIVDKEASEMFVFTRSAYFGQIDSINARYPYGSVHLKYGLGILTQVDRNFYTYWKLVRAFEDEFSIRTDSPDFSNVSGGLGLFGSMVEDSATVDLTF